MSTMPGAAGPSRRRRGLSWLMVLAFVVMPIIEIYILIQVGQVIGVGWTFLLVIAAAVAGGWLVRHEGARAWSALRAALDSGRMPTKELADGALILIGGTLMIAPGFVSDAFGILLVLPFTRPFFRRLLGVLVARKVSVVGEFGSFGSGFPPPGTRGPSGPSRPTGPSGPQRPDSGGDDRVVPGEVVDP